MTAPRHQSGSIPETRPSNPSLRSETIAFRLELTLLVRPAYTESRSVVLSILLIVGGALRSGKHLRRCNARVARLCLRRGRRGRKDGHRPGNSKCKLGHNA